MTKEKAIKIAKENGMERILDVCRFGNFHEVVGKANTEYENEICLYRRTRRQVRIGQKIN